MSALTEALEANTERIREILPDEQREQLDAAWTRFTTRNAEILATLREVQGEEALALYRGAWVTGFTARQVQEGTTW